MRGNSLLLLVPVLSNSNLFKTIDYTNNVETIFRCFRCLVILSTNKYGAHFKTFASLYVFKYTLLKCSTNG